jgi:hypothetical protein
MFKRMCHRGPDGHCLGIFFFFVFISFSEKERSPRPLISDFLDPLSYTHEAKGTPFQTHYFSENLVAPGIEPGTCGTVARNSDC